MADLILQTADWKMEKHVPVIDAPEKIKKGELVRVAIKVGKEIAHPNTVEHHIKSIEVYYLIPEDKFPLQVARFELNTHGESAQGPNTSTIYAEPEVVSCFRAGKSGTIL
ncbi:MAG: Neelaredoxin, partial [Candidatus Omnitrophica bacterium]|nr:Neelaredoxin [Candidatus Omnitrophota bacterium]